MFKRNLVSSLATIVTFIFGILLTSIFVRPTCSSECLNKGLNKGAVMANGSTFLAAPPNGNCADYTHLFYSGNINETLTGLMKFRPTIAYGNPIRVAGRLVFSFDTSSDR